ncbi:MAG: universal stress protein [Dehalococcoidia bacterium]
MKVLLALDGTRAGEPAAEAIAGWAKSTAAEIVLYSVLHPKELRGTVSEPRFAHTITPEGTASGQLLRGVRPPAPAIAEDRTQAIARVHVERQEYLAGLASRLFEGVTVSVRVGDGADAAAAIVAAAAEEGADFIAMATRGRSALGQAMFGAVHEDVVRKARVPVLLAGPGVLQLAGPVDID